MAENQSHGNPNVITRNKSEIQWDESQTRRHYANRSTVTYNREEIAILFGVEQVRQTDFEEIRVELTNRIVMRPLIAKQFAILLNETVRKYEGIWGTIEPAPTAPTLSPTEKLRKDLDGSGTEKSAEKAQELIRTMSELNVEIAIERSFKAYKRQLLDKRFLMGINCKDLEDRSEGRLTTICQAIGMPQNLLKSFMKYRPDANHIYFGFEENEKTIVYKAYLEFRDKIEEKIRTRGIDSESDLLFLGFKWDANDNTRQAITHYEWFPSLPVPGILVRLRAASETCSNKGWLEISKSFVQQAEERISHDDIQYLEVSEVGNPRKSFDINMYKAQLKLMDLYPLLLKTMQHYAISVDKFHSLYERIQTDRFGHLAAGVDREGRDFLTVYYGGKRLNSHHLKSGINVYQSILNT